MVKFCDQCNNLFSHHINETTGKLNYVCLICGNSEDVVDQCIIINELNAKTQDYSITSNIINDHTQPRTKKIPCPNPDCSYVKKNADDNPEIIMFNYNPTMLKLGFLCTSCRTYWKN